MYLRAFVSRSPTQLSSGICGFSRSAGEGDGGRVDSPPPIPPLDKKCPILFRICMSGSLDALKRWQALLPSFGLQVFFSNCAEEGGGQRRPLRKKCPYLLYPGVSRSPGALLKRSQAFLIRFRLETFSQGCFFVVHMERGD